MSQINPKHLIDELKDNMLKDFSKVKREIITCKNLEESVKKAYQLSQKNGIVLLSPACASFDMFDNFEDRGRAFKQAIVG